MRDRQQQLRLGVAFAAALGLSGCGPAPSSPAPSGTQASADVSSASPNVNASPRATIVVPPATAVSHRQDQAVEPLAGPVPTIRLFSPGVDAGEPTLGLLADGRIAFQGWNRQPEDKSETATIAIIDPSTGSSSVVLAPGSVATHDPYLWVDQTTNRIFTSHLQVPGELDPALFCVVIKFSDDAGMTWTDSARHCQATPPDRPRIITGKPVTSEPKGYPNVVYLCYQDDEAERGQLCARSLDGGVSFEAQSVDALPFDGRCNASFGHPAVGPDGSLWLVTAGCRTARVAVSHDEASSWQIFEVGGPETNGEGESGVALDRDGVVYVVWTAVDRLPRLVISRDGGSTWDASMNVAAPGVKEANIATLEVGGPGKVAIGYVASLDAPGGLLDPGVHLCVFQPCPDLTAWAHATWHAWLTVSDNALDASPLFTSVVLNDPASPIVRGNCGPGRCKSLADFLDVAIDGTGRPMLAFVACPDGICPTTSLRGAWASAPGVVGRVDGIDLR